MSLNQLLAHDEKAFGIMLSEIANPNVVMMLATAGLDFFVIDMEHGTLDYSDMGGLVTAARGWNVAPVVRIPEIRRESVLKPLDAGAVGIVVPQVEEVDQVEEVVAHAKYPDRGRRGVALRRAHSAFAKRPPVEYMAEADNQTLVLVQVETRRALQNLDRLAEVEGLGGFFIGPFDLSVDMGRPGELDHAELREAYRAVIAAAKRTNRVAAIHVFDPHMAVELMRDGIDMCSVSSEVNMLVDQASGNVEIMRDSVRV